jgi:hypothetical protein
VNKDGVSVYASALAQSIASPARRSLQDMLAEVSNTVFTQTFGAQLPYFQDAKGVPIYFRDASGLRA